MARALPESFRGRVLTNSVPAAMALADREEIDLLLCGGQVRHGDAACFGAQAEAFFAEFYADKAFLGSGGVHAQAGLTDYHPPEVATRRTIIAHAAASYVLADSSKLGAVAVHRVCPLSRVTAVLTDPEASAEAIETLAAAGGRVLRAPREGGPRGGLGGTVSPQDRGGHRGVVPPGETEAYMDQVTTGAVPEDEELESFGYRQQFVRSLRHFESFAVAFSFISITTGIMVTNDRLIFSMARDRRLPGHQFLHQVPKATGGPPGPPSWPRCSAPSSRWCCARTPPRSPRCSPRPRSCRPCCTRARCCFTCSRPGGGARQRARAPRPARSGNLNFRFLPGR